MTLNTVFGAAFIRAEVIWNYRRWSNSRRGLLPAHQTIYYYSKSDDYVSNASNSEYSPSTNVDQILQARFRDKHNKSVYRKGADGQVVTSGGKKGVPLSDVWDIPYLNPKAKERTGYPTQKPVLLLERIVRLASSEGDLVLDPFCGSGTTLVAASLLGRRALGIDVSPDAVVLANDRCKNPRRTDSALARNGRESYRQANEPALRLLEGLEFSPVQRNKGVDAILSQDASGHPVLVRVQRQDESLAQTVQSLKKAARGKNAGALVCCL